MYLSSTREGKLLLCTSEKGEWVTRGLIALKASRRNPASKGETGDRYCSRTRSLSINLSASIGT